MREIISRLKYSKEIKNLLSQGIKPPKELISPDNLQAYRWVFENPNAKNHLPVYIQRPQRIIQAKERDNLDTSGFALSCYDNEFNSENNFRKHLKSTPNFWKIVGNSISTGILLDSDGRMTNISSYGHFDLYEFAECNLNSKFTIIKKII